MFRTSTCRGAGAWSRCRVELKDLGGTPCRIFSNRIVRTPCSPRRFASVRPTGPPPTIATAPSVRLAWERGGAAWATVSTPSPGVSRAAMVPRCGPRSGGGPGSRAYELLRDDVAVSHREQDEGNRPDDDLRGRSSILRFPPDLRQNPPRSCHRRPRAMDHAVTPYLSNPYLSNTKPRSPRTRSSVNPNSSSCRFWCLRS